jgi:hypothetical protein
VVRNWRAVVLGVLFAGPFLVYLGLGFLWLWQRGWIWPTVAGIVWMATGVAFSLLAARWTRRKGKFLPYLDELAPETFSPLDRTAWKIVEEEADASETLPGQRLIELDFYIAKAKELAFRLAKVYHPDSDLPIDRVPLVEVITAFELAAEDLGNLTRQVPGADLITPAHVKTAVHVSGYLRKASDWYGYLLPLINPATGIPRLASQHLMVKPAWRDMQSNTLRWFYRAFVNRIGYHLIELYSGRLVVGAEKYRKLRKPAVSDADGEPESTTRLSIVFAGSQFAPISRLTEATKSVDGRAEGLEPSLAKLFSPAQAERLARAEWIAAPSYTIPTQEPESARDVVNRGKAVECAAHADLMIQVIDDYASGRGTDLAFLKEWKAWFDAHPQFQRPPAIIALAHADSVRLESLRSILPDFVDRVVAFDPNALPPGERMATVLPALIGLLARVERVALVRELSEASSRSKVGRLFSQLSRYGHEIWTRSAKTGGPESK